jgi:hypothetical protein
MTRALDRWDAAPFLPNGTTALAEAVITQLMFGLGPPGEQRNVRVRLARTIVDLQRGAAGDGVTIAGAFRTREDCRDALAALLVPGSGQLDVGGRPRDREYIDAVAWGFTKGRFVRSTERMTDAQVARWLAEEWLPALDVLRCRPPKTYEARSVQRTWQRIKASEKQTLTHVFGGQPASSLVTRPWAKGRKTR